MQSHFHAGALALAAVLSFPSALLLAAAPSSGTGGSPRELVQAALAAELRGDRELRADLLEEALSRDPTFAPARWQSGFVRVGNRWLSVESAASESQRAGTVARYRQLRDQVRNTAAGHLQLAQWCSDEGLKDQERVHLIYAMQCGPTKAEAQQIIKKLDLVFHQKTWMPAAQAEWLKEEARSSKKAIDEWKPRLPAIQRDLESHDVARRMAAIDQLRAIERATSAVPVLETLIAKARPAAAPIVIRSIASIPGQAATDALLRCAVFAKDKATRTSAAGALKSRSVFSYVPTLMGAFEPLVQVQLEFGRGGNDWHRLSLYQEGPMMDRRVAYFGGSSTHVTLRFARGSLEVFEVRSPDQTADFDSQLASNELVANARRQEVNERVAMVLRTATGHDLDSQPAAWWSWWFDYNEVYLPPDKPLSRVVVDAAPVPFTLELQFGTSCFPAGTPVQTSTGFMAIEQVRPGDCVLAQDPETGELAFKPVLATTVRPASPLINVRTAGETIRATRGHPFWVSGVGWQMAKELKAGQWLHTATGPVQIESAEEHGQAECYNLVVADFNAFFVGESQVLVHDNNLRQVTTATVPGLIVP